MAINHFNVVIVGNGAIGSAVLENLLQRQELMRAVVLGRSAHTVPEDERVTHLTFDAEDPQSVMTAATQVNAVLLLLLAQAFSKLLRHDEPAVLASLSARVGSIEDNQLGGWYSYRASKAVHNMLLKTIAREWRIRILAISMIGGVNPYPGRHRGLGRWQWTTHLFEKFSESRIKTLTTVCAPNHCNER